LLISQRKLTTPQLLLYIIFFIDASRYEDFSVIPFWNDLSDHDAPILTINIPAQKQSVGWWELRLKKAVRIVSG
jgi:hypothetical protein